MRFFIVFSLLGLVISTSFHFDKNLHCDEWAHRDKECVNNPGYMWSSCLSSCIKHAEDTDGECERYGKEGECTNNPTFMHYVCPQTCGIGAAWSPWVRRELGIADIPFDEYIYHEQCDVPSDVFAAAELMKSRVAKYLGGAHNSVKGLASSSPSEYLGMMGLAEGVLYVLRLHNVVIESMMGQTDMQEEIGFSSNYVHAYIANVEKTLSSGYEADLLMRELPNMLKFLDRSTSALHRILHITPPAEDVHRDDLPADTCIATYGPPMSDIPKFVHIGSSAAKSANSQDTSNVAVTPAAAAKGYTINDHLTLHNGVQMPLLGLGTWQLDGQDCANAVYDAITVGYRMFDTAEAYRNEAQVGEAIERAISEKLVTREELFIATKLSDPSHAGYDNVKAFVQTQLAALRVTYLDLYMLHSPLDRNVQGPTWRALEELHDQGILRSIGVSNFDERELRQLVESARIKPVLVQNKLDIYHYGKQLDNQGDKVVEYAKSQSIVVQAYSSLSAYPFALSPLDDPIVRYVAATHEKHSSGEAVTSAQVLLRWTMQHGLQAIPRSSNKTRLAENLKAFTMTPLSSEEMELIDSIQYLTANPVSKTVPAV